MTSRHSENMKNPRILYVENLDRYVLTHRLAVARYVQHAGFEVMAAAGETNRALEINQAGIPFAGIPLIREGTNPIRELYLVARLFRLYNRVRPDIIHHFNIKPVTYGTFAARLLNIPVVNTITGLGQSFDPERRDRVRYHVAKLLYRQALAYRRSLVTFQNSDDYQDFITLGLVPQQKASIVFGSGVDCDQFTSLQEPESPPIVAYAARLLWEKGIGDFVTLARQLGDQAARFVVVGEPDPDNRHSVPVSQIESWVQQGIIEWWGYQDQMPSVLSRASIVVLPSLYREGVPKILIEAAATRCAIVTYDMPGCREIVKDGLNGILVQPGDQEQLAAAVTLLLNQPELRQRYGQAGREHVLRHFSQKIVADSFIELYQRLLPGGLDGGMRAG